MSHRIHGVACRTRKKKAVSRRKVVFDPIEARRNRRRRLVLKKGTRYSPQKLQDFIHVAVFYKNSYAVQYLIKIGIDIDVKDENDKTALHLATSYGSKQMVHLLLKAGANVNASDERGNTPLGYVALSNVGESNRTILTAMLQRGGDPNVGNVIKMTPFHNIVQRGNVDMVKLFINYGADIKKVNYKFKTVLHLCAQHNDDEEVILFLLECYVKHNLNLEDRCAEGRTPLIYAAIRCKYMNAKALLANHANINATCNSGWNTLCYAIVSRENGEYFLRDRIKTIDILLHAGSIITYGIFNAFDLAIEMRDQAVLILLLNYVALRQVKFKTQILNKHMIRQVHETPQLAKAYVKFSEELTAMKQDKIEGTTVSFLKLLIGTHGNVAKCFRNPRLLQNFRTSNYQMKYPGYSRILDLQSLNGIERLRLEEEAVPILHDTIPIPKGPRNEIITHIVQYLTNEDLMLILGEKLYCIL